MHTEDKDEPSIPLLSSSDEECTNIKKDRDITNSISDKNLPPSPWMAKMAKIDPESSLFLNQCAEKRSSSDICSTPSESTSFEKLREKSLKIKEREPSGGYLDVSICNLFDEEKLPSAQSSPENEILKSLLAAHQEEFEIYDAQELITYPPGSINVIRIEDYKSLDVNEMLSGNIIDFYIDYYQQEIMAPDMRKRVHFCYTLFYNLYAVPGNFKGWNSEQNKNLSADEKRYLRVKDLNQDVNLFEKDFIVIPCLDKKHWFLAIACYIKLPGPEDLNGVPVLDPKLLNKKYKSDVGKPIKRPCILIFNSLKTGAGQNTGAIIRIRNFLESEYKAKYQDEFPFVKSAIIGCHVSCPEQDNSLDCGLFLLEFIEHFFHKSPITDFRKPFDFSDWFDPKIVAQKRGEIAEILKNTILEVTGELPNLPEIVCVPIVKKKRVYKKKKVDKSPTKEAENVDDQALQPKDNENISPDPEEFLPQFEVFKSRKRSNSSNDAIVDSFKSLEIEQSPKPLSPSSNAFQSASTHESFKDALETSLEVIAVEDSD